MPDRHTGTAVAKFHDERDILPTAVSTPLTRDLLFRQLSVDDEEFLAEKIVSRLFQEAVVVSS